MLNVMLDQAAALKGDGGQMGITNVTVNLLKLERMSYDETVRAYAVVELINLIR
jgi:hypothetical protein